MKLSTRRLLIAFAVVVIVAMRKSNPLFNPQFWAEDGGLFFINAEMHRWGDLFQPYEGYLHFIPRCIAAIGIYLPLAIVPQFYAGVALLLTGVVAWRLQSPALSLPGGTVAALAIALVPHNGEIYVTISNLQWIAAIALFALTITADAETWPARIGDSVTLILTGLTGPFILLSLPLFGWRCWQRRTRASAWLLALALACAAAHVPSLLHRPDANPPQPWRPLHYSAMAGKRVITTVFLGPREPGEIACRALALGGGGLLAFALWRRRGNLTGGGSILFAAVAVLIATGYKARIDTWNLDDLINGDRYFFIAKVFLIWLLAALATGAAWRYRAALGVMFVNGLVSNASRFFVAPSPDQHWREYAAKIEAGIPTTVPILPEGFSFPHPGRRPTPHVERPILSVPR